MTANLAGMLVKAPRNELSGEFVVIGDEVAVGGWEGGVVEATTSDCCRLCPLPRSRKGNSGTEGKRRKIPALSLRCFFVTFFCAEGFCIRATFCGFCGAWHAAPKILCQHRGEGRGQHLA